jgi:hypothetical protein
VKSSQELQKVEGKISKSSAPSKTKPVMERLFQSTGAKAFVDRPCLPERKGEEKY